MKLPQKNALNLSVNKWVKLMKLSQLTIKMCENVKC